MIDEIKEDADERMGKSLDALHTAFARIRTGRANPSLLDGIEVAYYGSDTPLNQVASISVEDARTLVISPWEKKLIPDIEKAILKTNLGLTPNNDGKVVRLSIPALTEERRKGLVKVAHEHAESSRNAVRQIRRDGNDIFKKMEKDKEISEDQMHDGHEKIQKLTDTYVGKVGEILERKEQEILEV